MSPSTERFTAEHEQGPSLTTLAVGMRKPATAIRLSREPFAVLRTCISRVVISQPTNLIVDKVWSSLILTQPRTQPVTRREGLRIPNLIFRSLRSALLRIPQYNNPDPSVARDIRVEYCIDARRPRLYSHKACHEVKRARLQSSLSHPSSEVSNERVNAFEAGFLFLNGENVFYTLAEISTTFNV